MKNSLEDFIHHHREDFDDQIPSDKVWNHIQQGLQKKYDKPIRRTRLVPVRSVWQVAAGFSLLLICSLLAQREFFKHQTSQQANHLEIEQIYQLNPELAETEQFYIQQISLKKRQITQYDFNDREFKKDLKMLEKSYEQLKADLIQSGNDEQVLYAMIQNLQLRMNILSQQIELLEQIKNFKNINSNQNEKINTI